MAKLTKAQRARLDKLATYLERLPKRYRHFEMKSYVTGGGSPTKSVEEYALTNGGVESCGTAACAAGHGPAAGILVPPRLIGDLGVRWSAYTELFTGENWSANDFLFSGLWTRVDNHHYGAAARIRYLLAAGKPPLEFNGYDGYERSIRLYAPYRIDAKAPANA